MIAWLCERGLARDAPVARPTLVGGAILSAPGFVLVVPPLAALVSCLFGGGMQAVGHNARRVAIGLGAVAMAGITVMSTVDLAKDIDKLLF